MGIGSRTLVAVCGVFVLLLATLAVVQYRWSTRVAAADAQREREHLESAASLFANEFNGIVAQSVHFLQNEAHAALRSRQPLAGIPPIFSGVYYVGEPTKSGREIRRLGGDGLFEPVPKPDWIAIPRCAPQSIDNPPAIVAPIYDVSSTETRDPAGNHVLRTYRSRKDHCFVARINQAYLGATLFPELIRRSFRDTAVGEYIFAVAPVNAPGRPLYGEPLRPDLRKAFFSLASLPVLPLKPPGEDSAVRRESAFFVLRLGTVAGKGLPDLPGPGVWELQIAHKGVPLSTAFEQTRRRNLLLSIGVETLLVAVILFLVVATRRMQRFADQKIRFVAGVSHELRTPVSAIAMLSRNQADGLVSGADKVKQYGELIHQQARRLNEMVEQTLAYAGIHSGLRKPATGQVDLAALIGQSVDARREELTRRGFDVEVALAPDLPTVAGDASLLRTAFDNLIDNALKHGGAGRWIRVSAVHADKKIRITVEDHGDGVTRSDQSEIFEPFCRGRAAIEAQIPGSGLGLSLVRSAAEAHHGSVTLVSELGRGSAFTMHLPV